jgi:hypothetical protein
MQLQEIGPEAAYDIEEVRPGGIEAFQKGAKRLGTFKGLPEPRTETSEDEGDGRWYRCRHCGSRIARAAERISVNGRFSHVFNNPAGYIFEIGCFAAAQGCVNEGEPTLEFTWFAGFSWRFALCASCRLHLGWRYQSMKGGSFYGLILANLTEESRSGRDR